MLNFTERNENVLNLFQECLKIMKDKGPSYASSDEANDNFYQIAKDLGMEAHEVWGVYFYKHLRSLSSFLKDGTETSEGVQENIKDMINYLAILSTMIDDNWGEGSDLTPIHTDLPLTHTDLKVTSLTDSVPVEIVTINNQRAVHFNREGNMNDFTPDFKLAGVNLKTAELNANIPLTDASQ